MLEAKGGPVVKPDKGFEDTKQENPPINFHQQPGQVNSMPYAGQQMVPIDPNQPNGTQMQNQTTVGILNNAQVYEGNDQHVMA